MDKEQFDVLVDTVLETTARPPEKLFACGRIAHCGFRTWHPPYQGLQNHQQAPA